MDYQHYQKSLINSFHLFKFASLIPTPSPFFIKIKYLLDSYISRYVDRAIRAVKTLKSTSNELLYKKIPLITKYFIKVRRGSKKRKKVINSINIHINYSSLHVIPIAEQVYYESNWNIPTEETPLAGYLQWLDDRNPDEMTYDHHDDSDGGDSNDIDHLAESFIARCYEKFRIEKQESYRRYQEMMARSL